MIPLKKIFLPCSLLVATGASLLASGSAGAQDFTACRAIADDTARLACFDRASQAPTPTPTPVEASPIAPPVARPNPYASFGLGTPAPTKPEDFGRSSMPVEAPKPPPNPAEPAPITSLTAKVTQVIDPDGKPKFVLDNKQVWVALNYTNINIPTKSQNTVRIESYPVGFMMSLNDSSFEFAVRRLK
jgi:hypothetical protein